MKKIMMTSEEYYSRDKLFERQPKTNNKEIMTQEQFEQEQAAMSNEELIELAGKQVSELARTGGRSHRMCVPPMITDTDMLFSELIRRFKSLINRTPDVGKTREEVFAVSQVPISQSCSYRIQDSCTFKGQVCNNETCDIRAIPISCVCADCGQNIGNAAAHICNKTIK
jgi:hypothetical protein